MNRNYGITVQAGKSYIISGRSGVSSRYLIFLDDVPNKADKVRLGIRVNRDVNMEVWILFCKFA